jgi:uncharacterized Zn finger protein (UPF0148 family)
MQHIVSDYDCLEARLVAFHQKNGTTPCPILAARIAVKRQQHAPKRPQSIVQQFLDKFKRTIKAAFDF